MIGSLVLGIVSALLTIALIGVTWIYTKLTRTIASETANAASAARDAAQINLLQSLLAVQPLVEVTSVDVTFHVGFGATGEGSPAHAAPTQVSWAVTNFGNGIAFHPKFRVMLGNVLLRSSQDCEESDGLGHLRPGQQVSLRHVVNLDDRPQLTAWIAQAKNEPLGVLTVLCQDSFGSLIESEVDLVRSGERVWSVAPKRTYEGSRTLRAAVQQLLDRLLPEPEDKASAHPRTPR